MKSTLFITKMPFQLKVPTVNILIIVLIELKFDSNARWGKMCQTKKISSGVTQSEALEVHLHR